MLSEVEDHSLAEDDTVGVDDHIAVAHRKAVGNASVVFGTQAEAIHMILLDVANVCCSDPIRVLVRVHLGHFGKCHCGVWETGSEEPAPVEMRCPDLRVCWSKNQLYWNTWRLKQPAVDLIAF